MKILFNKSNNGQAEIKLTLGFLDADFTYKNIEPDLKLNTPYLIDLIGKDVYNKIADLYDETDDFDDDEEYKALEERLIALSQLYIASFAYLDFAPNNDLSHSNSGRQSRTEENDKAPAFGQLKDDESATRKRAYKALDQIFTILEELEWSEWTLSDAYKTANALFIKNPMQFDKVFPIAKSGQLYYRLVPFMDDFESDRVAAILTDDVVATLKAATSPTAEQNRLLVQIHKAVAYLSLGKAYKAFPVEMFPDGLAYNENTSMKAKARAEVMEFLNAEGEKYLKKLEYEYQQQNETFEEIKTMNGLEEGKKYVNL